MKTIVLAIEPISDSDSLKIWLSIGSEQHSATFSRKFDDFGGHQLQIITYNKEFGETFKFNQQIIGEVMNLVKQVYRGETVELPAEVGDFGPPESALGTLKPFLGEKIVSNRELPLA